MFVIVAAVVAAAVSDLVYVVFYVCLTAPTATPSPPESFRIKMGSDHGRFNVS